MDKLVRPPGSRGAATRRLGVATTLAVTASLLVAGQTTALASPTPQPGGKSAPVPAATTFPRPDDPDAPLRAAVEEAKKQGQPVPVEAAYTETSRTWAHPDGRLTTQSYGGPAQLKQADGSWAWIDTTLVEQDGVLKPKLAKANVSFSLGGDGPFVSMERDKGQRFALSWQKDLPRPEVDGNIARYVDAAGPGADLVVTALATGFRHDVVLRGRPTGPVEFRLPVATDKLKLSTTKRDGLKLTDGKGKTVMSAPTPRMWDAAAETPTAGQPGRQAAVETEVETRNGATELVLKPDAKWLADPATRYPVTVDPTTTLGISQEVGIRSPNSQSSPGYVGRSNSMSGDTLDRALMAFDTSSIAGRQVVRSTMQLMLRSDVYNCSEFQGIVAQRITQPWVANDTFWSRQPATTAEGRSSLDPCSLPGATGSVWSWDLTAMTQMWASGTANNGLMLSLTQESPVPTYYSESFAFWAQLWGQNVPKLSVDWVLPPEIPTVTAESIDSMNGNDAIARSTNVKVTYKSSVPEATKLNYTVTVNDSTMATPAAQLPAGEAAYWKFDESTGTSAADSSGKNLPATLDGPYTRGPGLLGQAVTFTGGAYAATGKPVINTNQSFTTTSWVRLNSSASEQTVLSQMGVNQPGFTLSYSTSDAPEYDQRWNMTVITQDIPTTIRSFVIQSKNLAKIREWTHVAAQYDATANKIRLYVDGVLAGEGPYTAAWNARGAFEIGRARALGGPLDASIDDVHIYQRALTGEEIRALVGVPSTTTHNNIPSGQVLDKVFTLDNPASFKFVVKACRTGVTPPSCNESPAYRITSDAPMLPSDTETGMADPAQPILSGMLNRPSGGPVTAKYYLYDNAGTPIGAAPLGSRTVSGGERASFQIPANTVQPGTTYKWQMTACASSQDGTGEVCTSKTAPVSFTTPGTPPPPPVENVKNLTLGKDSFVIKTAKTDPTACNGAPCTVTGDTVMRIGGVGVDKTAAVIGVKLNELPAGAGVSEGILKLGAAICPAGTCPADAVITATPLKSPVTAQTKGSELAADADTGTAPYSLPLTSAQADIAGSEYQWLMLTSNKDELITFADVAASEQPSLALTYLPAGPPSKVLNLATQPGDGGAIASWGLPESTGSVAMLNGYDVEVTSSSGGLVKTLEATDPYAAITGLTNGENHTIKVRAKTEFGISDWVSATVTPKAVPPPPVQNPTQQCIPFLDTPPSLASVKAAGVSGAQEYITRVQAYFGAQDAVLEGRAATIWDAPGVTPQSPSTAKLSLLNTPLANTFGAMRQEGATRTGSSVNLSDVVVQGMPDGKVHVSAQVRRTWRLQSTSASTAKTAGTVDPSESTISIFVFDRCGNIQEIQAPNPAYEDPTDNDDPKPYPPSAGGSAPPPPVWGSTTEWYKARVDLREGTSQRDFLGNERDSKTKKLRFGKGWFVQARSESYWDKHEPQWSNRWMIRNFVNRVQVYPQKTSQWFTKYGKALVKHMKLEVTGSACLTRKESSTETNYGINLAPGGGLTFGGTSKGTVNQACNSFKDKVPAGQRPEIDASVSSIDGSCLGVCYLKEYKHSFYPVLSLTFKDSLGLTKTFKNRMTLECKVTKFQSPNSDFHHFPCESGSTVEMLSTPPLEQ